MPKAYSELQIQCLNELLQHLKTIYTSDIVSERWSAMKNAEDTLQKIKDVMYLTPPKHTENNLTPKSNTSASVYGNDSYAVVHVNAPTHVSFYQYFEIQLAIQNTGKRLWVGRYITANIKESGPCPSDVKIPTLQPDGCCSLHIPVNARGFGGKFELELVIRDEHNSENLFDKTIKIPIEVGFAPGIFGE